MEIKIGNKVIGGDNPCFIIAELGINHNGDVDTAKKMIDAIVEAGADAVKAQTFKAKEICDPHVEYTYETQGEKVTEKQLDMFSRYQLEKEDFLELKNYCEKKKIIFFSTPQNISDLDLLMEVGVPLVKTGSDDLVNIPLINNYSKRGLPMIISTGMAYLSEIDKAVRTALKNNKELIIFHCVSTYPAADHEMNLRKIQTLQKQYLNCVVGFSDHSLGIYASLGAVALGAKVIEKHFTLDKNMRGPDHRFSIDSKELTDLVNGIRFIEKALGTSEIGPVENEMHMRDIAHRSIVAGRDIKAGESFTEENLIMKRPGTGLPPELIYELVGKKAKHDIRYEKLITLEDIGG